MFDGLTVRKPTKLRILLLPGYTGLPVAAYTKQFEQKA